MREQFRERLPLIRPLFVPFILFSGMLTAVSRFLENDPASPWRYPMALLPMIPALFLAVGIVGAIRRLDELNRKIILESMAVSFASTLFLTICLGLLGLAGMNHPSSIYLGLFMVVVWLAAKLILTRRYE